MPARPVVVWKGDDATRLVRTVVGARLRPALGEALAALRARVGTPGPPRSTPGAPPRKDSGELLASLFVEVDLLGLRGRIGAAAPYAGDLERGTSRMAARPFFESTIVEVSPRMGRKLAP